MKKLALVLIIVLTIILRIPQTSGEYISLVLSLGSVIGIWFLARLLSFAQKFPAFPEICSLFLAISPWHIFITKYQEKSLIIFLTILVIYLITRFFRKHRFFLAAFFLVVTIFIITNPVKDNFKSFSNTQAPIWLTDEQRREHGYSYNNPLVILEHNKFINYSLAFLDLYSQHFQGDFLFISGDIRGMVSSFGQMYFFDFFFIALGLISVIKNLKEWEIIFLWLLLAPFPSALDFQPPNAIKAANMIVPLIMLSSFGASLLFRKIKKNLGI